MLKSLNEYRSKSKLVGEYNDIYDLYALEEQVVLPNGRIAPKGHKGHRSLRLKSVQDIKKKILEGFDINKKNENGDTILNRMIKDNRPEVIRHLRECGASV